MSWFKLPTLQATTAAWRATGRTRERGSVLTEFVMVAPVMLLIAGSALRFQQELQAQEIGVTLSREIATLAYNRCIDKTITTQNGTEIVGDPAPTADRIAQCLLLDVIDSLKTRWDQLRPIGASATLSLDVRAYRCDIAVISPTSCTNKAEIRCLGDRTCSTNLSATKDDLTAFRNRLVVARISFEIAPLAAFIPSISARTVTYEATV